MRIWDIHPGYLNNQSLLGEHRELHGIASIISHNKQGYSRHPETLRWKGYGWALARRHQVLRAEMALRGFIDKTPLRLRANAGVWPEEYIDAPSRQFDLLAEKYRHKAAGRIPLPANSQVLWAQHKYSVLARDPQRYRDIGHRVAGMQRCDGFGELALELTELLRTRPEPGQAMNALQHMWGYVSDYVPDAKRDPASMSPLSLLAEVQRLAMRHRQSYLLASTALSDLAAWL